MADQNPNPAPTPTPEPTPEPTSADIVNNKFAKTIKSLETRINVLEDGNKALAATNKSYEEKLALLAKTPSKLPGKSLLQELEEFIFPPKPQA